MVRMTKTENGDTTLRPCWSCNREDAYTGCGRCTHESAALQRLSGYEDTGYSPEELRAILPPVKVGDRVYAIRKYKGVPKVAHARVTAITYTDSSMRPQIAVQGSCSGEMGVAVFITKQAAEAAVDRMLGY